MTNPCSEAVSRDLRETEAALLQELAWKPGLKAASELANDVVYTTSMTSSWRAPRFLQNAEPLHHHKIRQLNRIIVEGEEFFPPTCMSFREGKLPSGKLPSVILSALMQREMFYELDSVSRIRLISTITTETMSSCCCWCRMLQICYPNSICERNQLAMM